VAKKHAKYYQHPLDQFLATDNDGTMLGYLANQFAEELLDKATYRNELTKALKKREYRHKQGFKVMRRTFNEMLQQAGLLEKLLSDDTLQEFWKSQLLDKILKRKTELQSKRHSVDGRSLTEHRRKVKAIQKDLETIERLTEKYGLKEMGLNIELISWEALKEWRPLNRSRWTGSKRELLIGGTEMPQRLNREDMAIQVTIYRTLKSRLHQPNWRMKEIPDIFMCQLAELIWRPSSLSELSSGETLRRADRDMPGW